MKIKIFDIKYDTDGEDIDLPPTLEIDLPNTKVDKESIDVNDLEEELSDHISNVTGFCHFGFKYEIV